MPTISTFEASPNPIHPGGSANLTWQVSDFESLELEPAIGDVSDFGALDVSPPVTTTYTLTASNDAGSASAEVTVGVYPSIESFLASPGAIDAGDSVQLSWSVHGDDTIEVEPGVGVIPSGTTVNVIPPYSVTYTLVASNDAGSVGAQASVVVRPRIDLTPSAVTLHAGASQIFLVTIAGTADGGPGVSWSHGLGPACSYPSGDTVKCNGLVMQLPDGGSQPTGATCAIQAKLIGDPSNLAAATVDCEP